ncbi:hypothetical protein B5F96_00685 [Parabacteroides johnsonii]|uniref:Uncharacterized protein n=1 Tax=Parabacteroides johnsonii TaxID=387661 RepID=A0A9Q5X9E4_9BACT|nr:hypothetical protein B5F96_00685 [Parabacteroides johnsonii]
MRVCQIDITGRRQRRRAQTDADILIISKINLRPSVYSASSASGNINLTPPQGDFDTLSDWEAKRAK